MLRTNIGMEWGMDAEVNNGKDIVLKLTALKMADDDTTVLFKKIISQATLQTIIGSADGLTAVQKTKIIVALDNFRSKL